MITHQEYFVSSLIFLVVMGAILYVADRKFGPGIKNFFRKRSGGVRTEQGFIYGRHARARMNVALLIAAIETLSAIVIGHYNPFYELLNSVVDIVALMVGFYLGPILDRALGHVDTALDAAERLEERIESGQSTLRTEVGSAMSSAADKVRSRMYPTNTPVHQTDASTTPAQPQVPSEPDPQKAFDSYVKRK